MCRFPLCRLLAAGVLFACSSLAVAGNTPPPTRISHDVEIPEVQSVDDATLLLNGFGTRTRAVLGKVYIAALYVQRPTANSGEVFVGAGPKRLWIHLLRELEATEFVRGFEPSFSAGNAKAPAEVHEAFRAFTAALPATLPDDADIHVDFIDLNTVRLGVEGETLGEFSAPGFGNALLRTWIGGEPVQENLKKRLLGLLPPD